MQLRGRANKVIIHAHTPSLAAHVADPSAEPLLGVASYGHMEFMPANLMATCNAYGQVDKPVRLSTRARLRESSVLWSVHLREQ